MDLGVDEKTTQSSLELERARQGRSEPKGEQRVESERILQVPDILLLSPESVWFSL